MPIVSPIEAKSIKGRLIHAAVFAVLVLGGLTMVYPFLIMLSGSVRSELDQADLTIVPKYLIDDTQLYRKFLETKYNQEVGALMQSHGRPYFSFAQVSAPDTAVSPAVLADFREFVAQSDLPLHWQQLGGVRGFETVPESLRAFRNRLASRFDGDIAAFAQAAGMPVNSWLDVVLPRFDWLSPQFEIEQTVLYEIYLDMLHQAEPAERQIVALEGAFLASAVYPLYGQSDTQRYNAAHTRPIASFEDFRLPQTIPGPDQPTLRSEWIAFVTQGISPVFVGLIDPDPTGYQEFLRARYSDPQDLADTWGLPVHDFADVTLPQGQWLRGQQRLDYAAFLSTLPPDDLMLIGPGYAYPRFLERKYGSIDRLSEAHATAYPDFASVPLPLAQLEYDYALSHAGSLRWDYLTRNYVNVFDELVIQGKPLSNTVIFVSLCVVLALLINPLAAYAMSRFNLPGTYKFLLILMATTAFPPMVTLIPQFILLREMHLLNTMFALVLPFTINGYMIFLLKGFFDSLPQELYEAARIDGASELRMFCQITMALSKPILAVLGLQVFTGAYTAFLYPLLVAPDEDMWLISVWLFQFQARSSSSAVFASVVVASIPTLIIFLFAQRTIMRGIVVPTEK